MNSQHHSEQKNVVHTDETDTQDVANGSLETIAESTELRAWTWGTFSRSVLLQMILFGL